MPQSLHSSTGSVVKWVVEPTPTLHFQVRASLVSLYCLMYCLDQIANGTVDISYVDKTVETILRTKFALGLFESMPNHMCMICA